MPSLQAVVEADTSDADALPMPMPTTFAPKTSQQTSFVPLPVSVNPSFHAPPRPSPSPPDAAPRNTLVPAQHGAHGVPSPSLVPFQSPPSDHQTRTAFRRRTAPVAAGDSTRARAPCPAVRAHGSLFPVDRGGRGSTRGNPCLAVVVDGSSCAWNNNNSINHFHFHLHPPLLLPPSSPPRPRRPPRTITLALVTASIRLGSFPLQERSERLE